jgi:hypothetical protein
MTYWVTSSIQKTLKTAVYDTAGNQIIVSLANGSGTLTSVNDNVELNLGDLTAIIGNFSILSFSLTPPSVSTPTVTTTVLTTTSYMHSDVVIDNINSNIFTRAVEVKDYNENNFFTNASSYRKYISANRKNRSYVPFQFSDGIFYPQNLESTLIQLNDLYVALLVEFEINLASCGDYFSLNLNSSNKRIGSLLMNKYNNGVLFKANSPISSYIHIKKNNQYYSSTSEMSGIELMLEEIPNEKILVKYFLFNSIFSDFELQPVNSNDVYKIVNRQENIIKEYESKPIYLGTTTTSTTTSTSITTTSLFEYDTSTLVKQFVSINTAPIHFTLTAYRQ